VDHRRHAADDGRLAAREEIDDHLGERLRPVGADRKGGGAAVLVICNV